MLLIAAIAIGTTVMAGNFRERALNNSERELENTVLLLARHFDQQLEDFDVVQKDLIALHAIERHRHARALQAPDVQPGHPPDAQGQDERLSYVGGINIFDADGTLINSSIGLASSRRQRRGSAPISRAFKTDPQSPTMLIEPVHSRITGAWTTVIARKVTGPNGEFLGAIGRGIEPANFEKFFASLALGDGAAISMLHRDGTLLARYPHVDAMIGQNFKTARSSSSVLSKADQGTARLISPIDGQDRLGSAPRADRVSRSSSSRRRRPYRRHSPTGAHRSGF